MQKSNGKTAPQTKRSRASVPVTRKKSAAAPAAGGAAVQVFRPLTASSLKDILWETLIDLKHEMILPNRADAIAAQSREILRTVKIQLQVAGQAKRNVPQEIVDFSERR